jgi:hypothetical protein
MLKTILKKTSLGQSNRTAFQGFESLERVGQDSRHQSPVIPAVIELGTWRQSTVDGS